MRRPASIVFAVFAAFVLATGIARAETAAPQATIRDFYATLLDTMKHGPQLGERGRYDALAPAIRQGFDLNTMARMAVGPAWAGFSPSERRMVTDAFARYTIATYADRFDRFSGEKFDITGERSTTFGPIVESSLVPSNGQPVRLDYLMRQDGDRWQIADVYLSGTVSQVATLRAQFGAVLAQRGVEGLVDTLNRKAAMLVASTSAP
jgi:phospholipid transport system substrate-binding protein